MINRITTGTITFRHPFAVAGLDGWQRWVSDRLQRKAVARLSAHHAKKSGQTPNFLALSMPRWRKFSKSDWWWRQSSS